MAFNPLNPNNPPPIGAPFRNPNPDPLSFQNPLQDKAFAAAFASTGRAFAPAKIDKHTRGSGYTIPIYNDRDADNYDFECIVLDLQLPLKITGNDNMITIDQSAASARIALIVAEATRRIPTCNSDISIIDDEGYPRPFKILVNAAMEIRGIKNIIGEKAVMKMIINNVAGKRNIQMGAGAEGKEFRLMG